MATGRVQLTTTLACDADLQLRPRRVLEARASGKRMVYRLRTALGREITATAEHPFLTVSGWCKLGELREGAHVATARMLLSASHIYWDRVTSIEPVGVRETYDLRIEKDHNFLADDSVGHNSHAASFALIAYASAYLKAHHPAAFACALLNAWPMGFYHPATVVKDAQRHGVVVLPVDVARSEWRCTIETSSPGPGGAPRGGGALSPGAHDTTLPERLWAGAPAAARGTPRPRLAIRLGLRYVLGLREEAARR